MEMWTLILLSVDLMLMGGILFILMKRRGAGRSLVLIENGAKRKGSSTVPEEFKKGLDEMRSIASLLERKRADLDAIGIRIEEKAVKLDEMIKRAEAAVTVNSSLNRPCDDVYEKARKMLKTGSSREEVIKTLGVLNGEAELISSLNRLS